MSTTKMTILFTTLLLIHSCRASISPLNSETTRLAKTFRETLNTNFQNDTLMFYGIRNIGFNDFPKENALILVQKLNQEIPIDKKLHDDFKWMSNNQRISVIFFVENQIDVDYLRRLLRSKTFSKGNVLIVFRNEIHLEIVDDLVQICRENGLFKIAFSFVSKEKNLELYTWIPFDENNFCGTNHFLQKSESYSDLFWDKRYNMKDCTLRLTYVKDETLITEVNALHPGILISLFQLIHNATGIQMMYENVLEFEKEFRNVGKFSSALKYLSNGNTDVLLGHLFMNLSPVNTRPGPQIYTDDIYYTVHKSKKLHYRNITRPFDTQIWILLLLIFIILFLFKLITKKYYSLEVSYTKIFFDIYCLALSIPIRRLSNKLPLQVLMISYIFYCTTVDAIYLGKLSSMFTIPKIVIPNVEMLYINGIYVTLTHYIEKLTHLCDFVTNDYVAKLIRIYNCTQYELLKRTVDAELDGAIVFKSTLKSYPAEAFLVDRFTTKMRTLFLCYYLRKHNIINEPIVYWTNEVLEKGFLSKWWADITLHNTNYTLLRMNLKPTFVVLSWDHYEEPILLLLIGYLLSTITLLFEIIFSKIMKRINMIKDTMPF